MSKTNIARIVTTLLCFWSVVPASATETPVETLADQSLTVRFKRLERVVESYFNSDVLQQLELVQAELKELREQVVEQDRVIADLKKDSLTTNTNSYPVEIDSFRDSMLRDQATYDEASSAVREKNYPVALAQLQDYIWQFPNGKYLPNAHFTLAEIYMIQWEKAQNENKKLKAKEHFSQFLREFPTHHKTLDVLLNLGIIASSDGAWSEAKDYFNKVKETSPNSSKARIAESKLQRLALDGRI